MSVQYETVKCIKKGEHNQCRFTWGSFSSIKFVDGVYMYIQFDEEGHIVNRAGAFSLNDAKKLAESFEDDTHFTWQCDQGKDLV